MYYIRSYWRETHMQMVDHAFTSLWEKLVTKKPLFE